MCGIAGGLWDRPESAIEPGVLARMVEALAPRGPDGEGTYRSDYRARAGLGVMPGVALGHRRLAIIDPEGGHQPMSNEDDSIWVVFNGEIYNHHELRRRLEATGHRLVTRCDTEVLVHLYEDEGPDMVRLLRGMFALAVWDGRRGDLLLARDRLGQKPLVYCHQPGRLLFASQLKSLLEIPGVGRELDPAAVDAYLTYQYVPHPRTILRGIAKLPPGHLATFHGGELSIRPYWQPEFRVDAERFAGSPDAPTSTDGLASELRRRLTESVRLRRESDVPLGAFLSGGVDSTIIVGLLQQMSDEPVRTFSIGFPIPEYDETAYATLVAEHFGTRHETFQVEPDAVRLLPDLIWHFDEPFADSSAVPTWYLAEQTRRHVTVALSGDGGDELFCGYPRYRAVSLAERLPKPLRSMLAARLWQRLPAPARQKSLLRRAKRFAECLRLSPSRRYLEWIAIFGETRRAELYTDDWLEGLPEEDPGRFVDAAFKRFSHREPVMQAALADLVTYLPCDLMTKVDTATMAHGLECRQPFLDHPVVELAGSLGQSEHFRAGRGKRLLHRAFADLLPKAIRRRPKMGFGVPLDHWFRGPLADWAREILLDSRSLGRGLFRPEAVTGLLDDHIAGRFDHGYRLWSLLVLELWQQAWLDDS